MKELSIIIVSFNTLDYTIGCLQSIKEQELDLEKIEVIVCDNCSLDGTPKLIKEKFPWVKLLENKKNLGFAAANNLAIKGSVGKMILLLNSDTLLKPNSLTLMLDFLKEHPRIGAATPRLELSDGALDLACHRGFPTPWNSLTYFIGLERLFPEIPLLSGYHQTYKNFNFPHEVDSISGACFFVKKEVVEQVGLLDERFFMYAEDIDWCMRIRQAGWQIYFNPHAKVIHFKKRSGRAKELAKSNSHDLLKLKIQTNDHFYQTMKIFYDKHYKHRYPNWLRSLVISAIWLKNKINQK